MRLPVRDGGPPVRADRHVPGRGVGHGARLRRDGTVPARRERAADHDEFEVWDAALHRSIIAATRSPLLIRLYAEVERARHGRVWGDLKRRSASAARRDEYRRDHEEIVTALRLRDADRATAAMRTHLARVSRHLLGTG